MPYMTNFLQIAWSVFDMASAAKSAKRDRSQTIDIEEVLNRILNEDTDPEGMSSSEESDLDRELENESDEWR